MDGAGFEAATGLDLLAEPAKADSACGLLNDPGQGGEELAECGDAVLEGGGGDGAELADRGGRVSGGDDGGRGLLGCDEVVVE